MWGELLNALSILVNPFGKLRTTGNAFFGVQQNILNNEYLPQDIWLYVLSAAIGGLISFLVTKLLNSSQNNAKRRQKIAKEHDERLR